MRVSKRKRSVAANMQWKGNENRVRVTYVQPHGTYEGKLPPQNRHADKYAWSTLQSVVPLPVSVVGGGLRYLLRRTKQKLQDPRQHIARR
jgi:hypothetical protein